MDIIHVEPLGNRALYSQAFATDVVLEWNQVLIDTLRRDATLPLPTWSSRSGAMMHAAIYDAINSIDMIAQAYLTTAPVAKGASTTAAAAAAGWRVLSAIYPDQQSDLDAALSASLARVKDGPGEDAGVAGGIYCADALLAARANDHSADVVPYTSNSAAGHWQPASADQSMPLGVNWGSVAPFAMEAGDQFRPPPVPAMTSKQYAKAFNEVKALGERNSTTRTAEQTEIGIFWGYDRPGAGTPPALYNQIAQTIANQQRNTLDENARLFALINISMADAGVAAWDCKYVDDFWRPITAIRRADEDGNPLTIADPDWHPLGAPGGSVPGGGTIDNFTPPFPAYVSGHATFGAALFQTLADFYQRDNIKFTLSSDELPGVTRSYRRFSDAAAENGISRIYLGIHWSFDNTQGQALGREISDFVFANLLRGKAEHGGDHPAVSLPRVDFIPIARDEGALALLDSKPEELL